MQRVFVDDIQDLFVPGRVRDVINDVDDGGDVSKVKVKNIDLPAGITSHEAGIVSTREDVIKGDVYQLNDDNIGDVIVIDGSENMIYDLDIESPGDYETQDMREFTGVIVPIGIMVFVFLLSFVFIPQVLSVIDDNMVAIPLMLLWFYGMFRLIRWAYKKSTHSSGYRVRVSYIPVWSKYRMDMSIVSLATPGLRSDFIDAVSAARLYGNTKMLREAGAIVDRAEDQWRKSLSHPEDEW